MKAFSKVMYFTIKINQFELTYFRMYLGITRQLPIEMFMAYHRSNYLMIYF